MNSFTLLDLSFTPLQTVVFAKFKRKCRDKLRRVSASESMVNNRGSELIVMAAEPQQKTKVVERVQTLEVDMVIAGPIGKIDGISITDI